MVWQQRADADAKIVKYSLDPIPRVSKKSHVVEQLGQ